MLFVYAIGCIVILLYYLHRKIYGHWESKNVPYEKPLPLVGNMLNVITGKYHLFGVIRDIYSKHRTPYVGMYTLNQANLMIRNPNLIKKVLVKDFDKFINRNTDINKEIDPIAYHTMFFAQDTNWKNIRTKLTPLFTSGKLKLMFPSIKECVEDLVTYIEKHNEEVLNFREVMKRYTVDVISSCGFGIHANCLKNDKSEMMEVALRLSDTKSFTRGFISFCYFSAPALVNIFRFKLMDKKSSKYLVDIFKKTLKEREKCRVNRSDFIDLLNTLKMIGTFKDGFKFDDQQMAAQAVVFFAAGNDTTASTAAFTIYELALNQNIQSRLRDEISETISNKGSLTYEAIHNMKYLDMVVNETLRKYPVLVSLSRKAATEYTFEETGLIVEKGTSIIIPTAGLHYDPEYFPDPEKFNPERFNDDNKQNIIPYTFLPFGDGPRICIGMRFAMLVAKFAVARIIKDFVVHATKETSTSPKLVPRAFGVEFEDGVKLRVSRIN